MNLTVKSAVVLALFGDVDHAFVGAIQGGVEDHLLILCATLDVDFAQGLVPGLSCALNDRLCAEVLDFLLQIAACLFLADV